MNKKNLFFPILLALTLFIGACAPAAEPTQETSYDATEEIAAYEAPSAMPTAPAEKYDSEYAVEEEEVYTPYAEESADTESYWPFEGDESRPIPGDNFHQDYGVNPWVDANRDSLSTFAVDVDTASYSVIRNYLLDGYFPPYAAVRVEEMINYFNQDYDSPRRNEAFALYADGAPSPFPNEEEIYVRFGVQGYEIPAEERPPLALTFVIDVSGSMNYENRLELVKWSLDFLVDQLREDDTVAIVAYTDDAFVVLEPTSGADWRTIKGSLAELYPMASTNLEEGLDLGYTLANKAYRRDAVNRVILCSDGVANVGNTTAEAILDTVGEWARKDIHLTSIGFGMGNFNDVLMEQLADKGDGFYAYVDNQDEAKRLFVDELTGSLITIGMNAKIQVAFNPEVVEAYRLIGFENRAVADEDFRNDDVDAGEIGAGHSVTALYAVVLNHGAEGEIATLQFRWEDPETGQIQEIARRISTGDLYRTFSSADPHFQLTTLVGRWGEILNESPYVTNTSLSDFSEYVWSLSRIFGDDVDVKEFLDLVEISARLKR